MSRFVRAEDGRYINLDHISALAADREEDDSYSIWADRELIATYSSSDEALSALERLALAANNDQVEPTPTGAFMTARPIAHFGKAQVRR